MVVGDIYNSGGLYTMDYLRGADVFFFHEELAGFYSPCIPTQNCAGLRAILCSMGSNPNRLSTDHR